jgi:hypothetical protein
MKKDLGDNRDHSFFANESLVYSGEITGVLRAD